MHHHHKNRTNGNGMTAQKWQKSTYSNPTGNCVEVAQRGDGTVLVRNSRTPGVAELTYTPAEMDAFIKGIKAGEFDQYLL